MQPMSLVWARAIHCTSLMNLKIPVCLYNSTMHLVHFLFLYQCSTTTTETSLHYSFPKDPNFQPPPLLYNIALYFHWSQNSELREAGGGGVGWLYSHFKFHFLILPLNLQGAWCVDHSWHGSWIGWWVNCAKFLFFS